ncbi:MAG TPA: hypothetical protein VG457_11100 [Planctomycetota bacterium]|jgi:hypothetical protein|nr:hypothetical protein [Planctomycetota bacterium]
MEVNVTMSDGRCGFPGRRWKLLGALAVFTCGCSARTQVRNASPESGVLQSHAAPFEKVQKAVLSVLSAASLPVIEERWIDRSRWSVLATTALRISDGRAARIIVEDHSSDCRVWVLVQSKPDVTDDAVSEAFQGRIAMALGLEARPEAPFRRVAGGVEERYRSPLSRCADLTSKACRDLGYGALLEDSSDALLRTISAEKPPSTRLFAALYRQSDEVTRIVVEVRGGLAAESYAEASAVHQELQKELQPEQ